MNYSPRALLKRTKFLGLVFVVMPFTARAEGLQEVLNPSVSLRQTWWERERSFESDKSLMPSSLWVTLRPTLNERSKLYVEGYVMRVNGRKDRDEAFLREAYLEYSWDAVDLKLGRQITVWGRADKLNPTDVFSTQSLVFPSPDDEDQRQGVGAVQLSLQVGPGRLIGIWQPEWQKPEFPLQSPPAGVQIQEKDPAHPSRQYGLKYDISGGDWDGSLSYAQAYDRAPDLEWIGIDGQGVSLALVHKPITMIGADAATTFGSYGFRAEFAHITTDDRDGEQALVKNSWSYGVVGLERNLIEDMNLNLQIFGRAVDDWASAADAGPLLEPLALIAQRTAQQQRSWQDGLSLRWTYALLQNTLTMEATALWNRQNEDGLLKPQIKYQWTDHWETRLGAVVYRGQDDTFFGSLRSRSSGFAEVRYQL